MKTLVCYFSHAGENYNVGVIQEGNTAKVARRIAALTGGDLFEIKPAKEYPVDYYPCIEQAQKELQAKARPALASSIPDLSGYDRIYLGYPNWWGDLPMCVYTFLESVDLSGKPLWPFCTHEGSGLGSTERKLKAAAKGAFLKKGLALQGSLVQSSPKQAEKRVEEWIHDGE